MPIRSTQNEFIAKSKQIFGQDTYGYEKVNYKNGRIPVILIFGELYRRTMERQDKLINLGYKIISIWESDFKIIIKEGKTK